ncbi:MAG: hypothetical protein RLZZ216_2426 [Cyanobacteriota bacterium]
MQFALQVYDSLGSGTDAGFGPVFAYLYDASSATLEGWVQSTTDPNVQDIKNPSSSAAIKYAILSSVPVPSPMPFFGAVATFRFSRKLRQRMISRNDPKKHNED